MCLCLEHQTPVMKALCCKNSLQTRSQLRWEDQKCLTVLAPQQDCSPQLPHDTAASCRITQRSRDHPSPTAVLLWFCVHWNSIWNILSHVFCYTRFTPTFLLHSPNTGDTLFLSEELCFGRASELFKTYPDIVWGMNLTSIKRSQEMILENLVNVLLQQPGFAKPCVSGNTGYIDISAMLPFLLLGTF